MKLIMLITYMFIYMCLPLYSPADELNIDNIGNIYGKYGADCPIPPDCRIYNKTGTQCVWASLEALGRWAEEEKLYNVTQRSDCQSFASPSSASRVLNELGVKFKQAYGSNKEEAYNIILEGIQYGRGVLVGVYGTHAIVLTHYDTIANVACIVDNSDGQLKMQTITAERFDKIFDGWALIIYPTREQFPSKVQNRIILPIALDRE